MESLLLEPFEADFMRNGAAAAMLVGILCGTVGCFVVMRGTALLAEQVRPEVRRQVVTVAPGPGDDLGRPGVEPDREAARGVPGSDRVAHDPPLVGADAVAALRRALAPDFRPTLGQGEAR
mgnify:CR=1 FL=1